MTCAELQQISDDAVATWQSDPSPANLQAMGAAYTAWFSQCGIGAQGGGTPLPPGGLD